MYTALKNAKGFIRYYWFDTGEGEAVPGNRFAAKIEADEPIQLVADFMKNSLVGTNVQRPGIIEGSVKSHD